MLPAVHSSMSVLQAWEKAGNAFLWVSPNLCLTVSLGRGSAASRVALPSNGSVHAMAAEKAIGASARFVLFAVFCTLPGDG